MRQGVARASVGSIGGLLLLASALGLPTGAAAQPAVCTGAVDTNFTAGPSFGAVGSIYTITIDLGAGTISGADPQFIDVSTVRYELDCQNIGAPGCTDEGSIIAFAGNLSNTADCVDASASLVTFTTTHTNSTSPNTVLFTASSAVRIPEGKSPLDADACQLQFDVMVSSAPGTDSSPLLVQGGAGYLANGTDAVCTNTLAGGAQSGTQITLCRTDCGTAECLQGDVSCADTDCESFECSTESGECVGTPEAASTPCDDTADTEECANPGCDGAGNCVATHIDEPDSTPCTDTGVDCFNAGCEAGTCVQEHTPVAASTPCDDTPDTEECANPGCDGLGACVATHIDEPDSTPCTDTGLDCSNAGCEAGTCVQTHTPVAASTPCDDVADTEECANPGCDGAGSCVADHIDEPDSTPCTDTGIDCADAGCEAGTCVQTHTPVAASTPCDDVADTEECANPGCDGLGACVATHIDEPDSTECADTDNNPCSVAGCEAGVCEQVHACEPDGKADCEITIGDFIFADTNGDG